MDDVKLKQDFENVPIAGEYLTKLAVNNKVNIETCSYTSKGNT